MSRLKQFKTIDEQIEILKDKGLIINDLEKTKEILLRENYFDGYPKIEGINFTYPFSFGIILLFVGLWFYYFRYKYLGQIR